MNDKIINRVTQFLSKELFHKMSDIAIFKNMDGSYELFNKYVINEENDSYRITLKCGSEMHLFSSLKNAVTWCTFDNRNKFSQTNRIEFLDQMIAGAETNIEIHKKLIHKSKDLGNKLIYVAKMSEEQYKRTLMVQEMSSFISESRLWQTRKFAANDK